MLLKVLALTCLALVAVSAVPPRVKIQPWNAQRLEALLHELEVQEQREFAETQQEQPQNSNIWVVLVAGSNEYYNYRHQADICHAYQIVKKHGVPQSNIITMMYDDIAYNSQNPRQGVIINKPGGVNVYPGVEIDYRANDVTPETFLKVITGDATLKAAGKKVLGSGPNDRVFIFFSDHGAPGLIAFPDSVLYASDLSHGLTTMKKKNMYKEMTFYIEACEAGSMFGPGLLPSTLKIYGLTAANAEESSYACYLDNTLDTYVGDCFSVNWMEDSDAHDIQKETLQVQYLRVKTLTNESHVMQYGDLSITAETVGNFQGDQNSFLSAAAPVRQRDPTAVPQEEAELSILLHKYGKANSLEEKEKHAKAIRNHIALREQTTALFERILTLLHGGSSIALEGLKKRQGGFINFNCYKPVLEFFHRACMPLNANSPALNHLHKLANLCKLGSAPERIIHALSAACQ